MTKGRIHSVESFGTVDGPGIRLVVFCQGCPMRCLYCHNPDTWEKEGGQLTSPQSLIEQFEKNRPFYRKGGITVTGGEPLLQVDFLIDLFRLAKERGIHTCIDTSGSTFQINKSNKKLDELMTLTDLVMLDVKHTDEAAHKQLTGMDNARVFAFARYLEEKRVPLWIRHVVVPTITDSKEQLTALGRFMGTLTNVKGLEVLPYHTMGVSKYKQLGLEYPLKDLPSATQKQAEDAKQVVLKAFYETRKNLNH
jgi:pyruvate formate lyase activating enzyme